MSSVRHHAIPGTLRTQISLQEHLSSPTASPHGSASSPSSSSSSSSSSSTSSVASSQASLHEFWEENLRSFEIVVRLETRLYYNTQEGVGSAPRGRSATGLEEGPATSLQAVVPLPDPAPVRHDPGSVVSHSTWSGGVGGGGGGAAAAAEAPGGEGGAKLGAGELDVALAFPGLLPATPIGSSRSTETRSGQLTPVSHPPCAGRLSSSEGEGGEVEDLNFLAHIARNLAVTALIEYRRLIQRACVYGVLLRDVYDVRQWIRHMADESDALLSQRQSDDMFSRRGRARDSARPSETFNEVYLTKLKVHHTNDASVIRFLWNALQPEPST